MQRRAPRLRVLLHLLILVPALSEVPDHYASPRVGSGTRTGLSNSPAQEYLDPTYPVPRSPPGASTCVVPVLSYSFANTYGTPPAKAAYAPPAECPAPWSLVVLSFSVAIAGDQYDRVAAVWLDGAELLRTTTAEPTTDGVRWTIHKDVTRYSALLRSPRGGELSVMLENLVNDVYTGGDNCHCRRRGDGIRRNGGHAVGFSVLETQTTAVCQNGKVTALRAA
jgi:hypothetical protein